MEVVKNKNKFVEGLKAKHDTKQVDKDSLGVKPTTMEGILENIVSAPERMIMVGPIGETSVKSTKPQENELHGKDGKQMAKEM